MTYVRFKKKWCCICYCKSVYTWFSWKSKYFWHKNFMWEEF